MKTATIHFLAGALALAGTAAWGQQSMRATIPFNFHVPGAELTSGNYEITTGAGGLGSVALLRATRTNQSHFVIPSARVRTPVNVSAVPAHLVFRCTPAAGCALAELWPGGARDGWAIPSPRGRAIREATVAMVPLAEFSGK